MVNQTAALLQVVQAEVARSGRSQADLAAASGINRVTLGRRLNGSIPFTWDQLYALGRALGVTPLRWFAEIEAAQSQPS
ncbi:helix-turn-helix domain-containing protein [Nakamurella lactea]|uniref:helix-turn-helix domain-containing protein n=1 Tax=Nakamurella lactea TaxID=459515 RepID=UPI0009FED4D0|nr:helix-turn-helix transcriptional regulator [Nakamurella lactea]